MNVELDWRAYFLAFSELHGGDPVQHGGRLYFRDGWSYSATDYTGPEWPPPADPTEVVRMYWQARKDLAAQKYEDLKGTLEYLGRQKFVRSAPMQHRLRVTDDEGKSKVVSEPVDMSALTERLLWLAEVVAQCDRELQWQGRTASTGSTIPPTQSPSTNSSS